MCVWVCVGATYTDTPKHTAYCTLLQSKQEDWSFPINLDCLTMLQLEKVDKVLVSNGSEEAREEYTIPVRLSKLAAVHHSTIESTSDDTGLRGKLDAKTRRHFLTTALALLPKHACHRYRAVILFNLIRVDEQVSRRHQRCTLRAS